VRKRRSYLCQAKVPGRQGEEYLRRGEEGDSQKAAHAQYLGILEKKSPHSEKIFFSQERLGVIKKFLEGQSPNLRGWGGGTKRTSRRNLVFGKKARGPLKKYMRGWGIEEGHVRDMVVTLRVKGTKGAGNA